MNINLIKLCSDLHASNKALVKEDIDYINDINNDLSYEDIVISENATDKVIDLVLVESGGSEAKFVEIIDSLTDPVIILSTGMNNSLPAALEIKTFCNFKKKPVFFLTGEIDSIVEAIKHIANICNTIKKISNNNLGVIGKPSEWLIASTLKNEDVKGIFGINLIDIPYDEILMAIDKEIIDENMPHYDELKKKYGKNKYFPGACHMYSALKEIIQKYNLQGLTIRCFDLLEKYKNTACLALAILNEEGITCACEGDVPSLITMHLLTALSGRPTFMANPSKINFEDSTLLLAHCTIPLNMCTEYNLLTHFESNLGIGIQGTMPEENITICKIAPDLKFHNDLCIGGKIESNLKLPNYCRTQIQVKLDEESIYSILKYDFGNHLIVTYSDVVSDFYPLLDYFRTKSSKYKKEKESTK